MSKREKSNKLRKDEEATAHVFEEFLQSFQISSLPKSKTFVRSSILKPNSSKEVDVAKPKIYRPQPLFKKENPIALKEAIECARLLKETKVDRTKEKPKSNLDALKEELKLRHSLKDIVKNDVPSGVVAMGIADDNASVSSSDPTTTNLFVSNLSPSVTENDLMLLFGTYGPLASVKIMWPRGDEKVIRTTNCGFVAFMCRKDGERALQELQHRDDMRVGWARPVEIPSRPFHVPPALIKMHLPPPPSGLPFNAQPLSRSFKEPTCEEEINELIYNSVVKVTVPLDKTTLLTVHRMIEFVVREGPLFEAFIMNREIDNPLYQFLFDNTCPVHTYYRWKLYSILQGEPYKEWSMKRFRMFKDGSIWQPPSVLDYTKGMPDELISANSSSAVTSCLSDFQCSRLVQYIRNMNIQRSTIAECMLFCICHRVAVKDIVDIIEDSFKNPATEPPKKVARLYLVSDILCNMINNRTQKVNAQFLKEFEERLLCIFECLAETLNGLQNQEDKEEFKRRIMNVLKSWQVWAVYERSYLDKLKSILISESASDNENNDDSDTEGPLDGESIIKRSLKVQMDANVSIAQSPCFAPSKWERVDPEEVEAQAMSTEKLYALECQRKLAETTSRIVSEQERKRLRDIEIKILEFQEELESGKRLPKKGCSIPDEIERYRKYLKKGLIKSSEGTGTEDRKRSRKSSSSSKSKSSKKSRK